MNNRKLMNKKQKKKKDNNSEDSKEVSDEELLGDINDIFGDNDSKNNEDNKDDKDNNIKNKDSDDIKTYEELYKKYEDYKSKCGMYKYDLNTKKSTHLFDFEEENYKIREYYVDSNDNMVFCRENYDYDKKTMSSSYNYMIEEYTAEGKRVNSVNINDILELKRSEFESYMRDNSVMIIDKDNIYVQSGDKAVEVINTLGESKGRIESDNYISEYVVDSTGNIVLYCPGEDKGQYMMADNNTLKITGKLEGIQDPKEYSSYSLVRGDDSSPLMLRDTSNLYKYDYKTDMMSEYIRWIDAGVIGENIDEIKPIEGGRFFYRCTNPNDGSGSAGIISERTDNGKDREVIKVMMLSSDNEMQDKIIRYNREDNEYKIELIEYDNDEDAATSFNNRIITGDIPDVIDVASVDMRHYITMGLLEDITSYVQEDDTVNENYFIDGFLDSNRIEGKLYYLSRNFVINTIAGKASELDRYKNGWKIEDIMDYYHSKPEGTKLFFGESKSHVFYNLVLSDINSYLDWDSGDVYFDSDEFRRVLEFCNTFPSDDENRVYDMSGIHDDTAAGKLLLRDESINGSMEIQVLKKLYDNDYVFVGYPCKEGNGTYMTFEHAFGICSGSDNKDGAWEVIKALISVPEKSQMMAMMNMEIPASRDEFEEVMRRETATEKYIDKYGNEIYPRKSSYGLDGYELSITPATEDEVKALEEVIRLANGTNLHSYQINDMLNEDVTPYFEGKKSLDEVVRIIQDRMSKYVNENR